MITQPAKPIPQFDLFGQTFRADPYSTYAAMQREAPLFSRPTSDGSSIWFVTRYDDVEAVLRDHRRFVKDIRNTLTSAEREQLPDQPPLIRLLSHHMLNLEPPDHTRLRALVNKAFTTRMVENLQPRIQSIADELLDRVADQGHMDLIDDYAFPLPITVIAELLGIPPRDRRRFRSWSGALVTPSPDPERNARKLAKSGGLMEDFIRYLQRIFAERRANPRDDLITSLLQTEEAGDSLNEEELYSMLLLLIVVGHETTVNLIGNGMLALFQHPGVMARIADDPTLTPTAVEEILRYDCPVERAPMRFAAEDVQMGGVTIRRGDTVSLVLGAANRDGDQFTASHCFDIDRTDNRHLGFGMGIHYCLGAPLARLEGRIAIDTLLQRLPGLHAAVPLSQLRWRTNPIMRGVQHMPVKWNR